MHIERFHCIHYFFIGTMDLWISYSSTQLIYICVCLCSCLQSCGWSILHNIIVHTTVQNIVQMSDVFTTKVVLEIDAGLLPRSRNFEHTMQALVLYCTIHLIS